MNQTEYYDDDEPLYDGPSKSQRKRDMHDLQDIGDELVALGVEQLKKMDLPDRLFDAIIEAKRLTAHGAIRRQSQYIGKIMRSIDAEPIRVYLDALKQPSVEHTSWLHKLERTRDRLLTDSKALTELVEEFPEADIQQVRQLIRNANKEKELNKPPKAYRELFQLLKSLTPPPTVVGDASLEEGSLESDEDE
ncbi:DUF615 domain-containing protein [Leeia sp. TBRC 13508]|uniref:Dual-action ribosomal maturation protein DarP n=1 Tax=Leeia speluncae TaxID=2884804 RepID=A0ABS8D8D4_9NEIS|nr:ribosome biogenesis factor YjgA [Leeia speluncae]MCB6184397.1 DUF615 domain-containing protein [Leeia speluncae]